jgi:hypothetical protein
MAKTNLGKVSLTPRGQYNAATPYVRLDVVGYKGSSYIILKPCQGIPPTGDDITSMLMSSIGADFTFADFTDEQLALLKGEKGDTGAQGIQGVKGDTGSKGDKGDKGDVGEQGVQGIQGVKGDKGDKGDTGAQGEKGEKGEKGDGLDYNTMTPVEVAAITGKSAYDVAVDNGFVGTVAEWLASLEGEKGEKGDDGEKGDTGEQGIQGERGLKGDKGDTGEQGVKGDTGAAGAKGDKGDTGAAGADGEDGRDGQDFEVPTLPAAPGENTLTYTSGGASVAFRIGQLARYFDTERGDAGEYVFYQLYDINNGKALWKLAGSGGDFVLPGETLTITLATDAGDSSALNGAVVKLTHPGEILNLTWQGQPLVVEIPYGVDYEVAPQDIGIFTAPAPQQFTSNVGYSRPLSLEYIIRRTDIIFDDSIADPQNITGHGEGAILDILAKGRRCLAKKTAEGEVTICYLDDYDTTKYHDGSSANLDGTEGDVMTVMAGDYYKIRTIATNKWGCDIAEKNLDGSYINDSISLVGTYKGFVSSNKLYSRSGVVPTASVSQANFDAYAKARGQGYQIIDVLQHFKLARLFYAKYGTRNSQAVLGVGGATYSPGTATGTTNSRGIRDTENETVGYVNFAGIEGVFGGFYEWVGGLTIASGVWTITNPDGTTRTGNATAATSSGWISKIAASSGQYFDVIPTAVAGSETTYYADYYSYSSGSRVLARSFYGAYAQGGVASASADSVSSSAVAGIASRLAFRGVIRIAESVAAFKALPVL